MALRHRQRNDDEVSHREAKHRLIMALRSRVVDEYAPVRTRRGYRYIDAERLTSLSSSLVRQILEELADSGELSRRVTQTLASCPSCGSIELQLVLTCENCGSQKIKKGIIYQCSNCHSYLLREETCGENRLKCPKCGVERPLYLMVGKFYACLNCYSIPAMPAWRALCRTCGSIFSQEEADTLELYSYSLENRGTSESIAEWVLTNLTEEITRLGYSLRINDEVKGMSGVMHRFSGVVRNNLDNSVKLVLDIVSQDVEVDEQCLLSFILKIRDVKAENSLLVVGSRINSAARRLAESQGVKLLNVRNELALPNMIKFTVEDILSKTNADNNINYYKKMHKTYQ